MRCVAKKEKVKLIFLQPNEGYGGYNYGSSAGDTIWIAPFVKAKDGDMRGEYRIRGNCDNPIEDMLITFFHEIAHCVLVKEVPSQVDGYTWNDTSKFQYELWITMLGIEYAHSKYGLKFSDQAVKWLMDENATYIRDKNLAKEFGYGLICTKATETSYTILSQWEFRGKNSKPKINKENSNETLRV